MPDLLTWRKFSAASSIFFFLISASASQGQTAFRYTMSIGSPGSGFGEFNSPAGIAVGDLGHDGDLDIFVADTGNNRIQHSFIPPNNVPSWRVIAEPGTQLGQVLAPHGLSFDSSDNLHVADTGNSRRIVIPVVPANKPDAGPPIEIMGPGSGVGQVYKPLSIWANESCCDGPQFVADTGNNRIQYSLDGGASFQVIASAGSTLGNFDHPNSVDAKKKSNVPKILITMTDGAQNRVLQGSIDPATGPGEFDLLMGPGTALGEVMAPASFIWRDLGDGGFISDSVMFVADTGNNRIQMSLDEGATWSLLAGPGSGPGQVLAPQGLAIGDINRDGLSDLIVADTGNNRLLVFAGVPEPSSFALFMIATISVTNYRRRRDA